MAEWEYMKLDLGQVPNRMNDIDVLNGVGKKGWELVCLTPNNQAYLKRAAEPPAPRAVASRKTGERSATA